MSPGSTPRISIVLPRRPVIVASWLLSLLLAGGTGWIAARTNWFADVATARLPAADVASTTIAPGTAPPATELPTRVDPEVDSHPRETRADEPLPTPVRDSEADLSRPPTSERPEAVDKPTAAAHSPDPVEGDSPDVPPAVDPSPTPPTPVASAAPEPTSSPEPEAADPEPPVASVPTSEPWVEQPPEPIATTAPAASPEPGALARAQRADRLAGDDEPEDARRQAEALLADYPSQAELTSALLEDGADELRARLTVLRVMQLAGDEEASTQLARELKREHPDVPEVVESIRRWRVLKPRIVSLESSVAGDDKLVVTGTLENPDIGDVRRVFVLVEALGPTGGVLNATRIRIQPKTLGPGSRGSFSVRFALDASAVLSTRASVIEWESEVLDAG